MSFGLLGEVLVFLSLTLSTLPRLVFLRKTLLVNIVNLDDYRAVVPLIYFIHFDNSIHFDSIQLLMLIGRSNRLAFSSPNREQSEQLLRFEFESQPNRPSTIIIILINVSYFLNNSILICSMF